MVLRFVAAPLTPDQQAKLEAERRKRERENAMIRQQRRFDAALLETYRGLGDIDAREARALEDVERSIAGIHERRAALGVEREDIIRDIAVLPNQDTPEADALKRSLRAVESEINSYQRLLEAKRAERESIQARFATDRRRYAELIADEPRRR